MNGQHFRAFLWLRWRLLVNQIRKGGTTNAVILAILAAGAALLAVLLFVLFLLIGLFTLPEASPAALMYVWDGLAGVFLFAWAMGVLIELQRSEVLSLEKFLHLPVSLKGAFLINYLSSLLSLTLLIFLPPMVALSLSLVFAKGPAMLAVFPLLAAFLLMVTALTYQFQGWLASLMTNPRRRRTVIVLVTAGFILLCQVPNLVNLMHLGKGPEKETTSESKAQSLQQLEHTFRLVNLVLPPGWLPLGAAAAAEGNVLPALLGTLGMTGIGAFSLWRSYRTTVGLYTGRFTSGKKSAATVPAPAKDAKPSVPLLERQLPGVSEQAAAVALGGFRSLLRAPEAKMMLLTPVLMLLIFGSIFLSRSVDMPEAVRPLIASGAMAMVLFTMSQLLGNQFGFDRSGFRVFVLSAAPRRDILLGKNLAFAPLALGMGLGVVVLVEVLYPMRPGYFLAALPQLLMMYLLFCLLANSLSIFAPLPIRSGSLKPVNPKAIPLLLHIAFAMLFPLALLPTLLPLGVALILDGAGWNWAALLCLVLSLAECAAVVWLYRLGLGWQGSLLQAREQKILEIVTAKVD